MRRWHTLRIVSLERCNAKATKGVGSPANQPEISCGLNNFNPTTYDVPGRYLYARATIKM